MPVMTETEVPTIVPEGADVAHQTFKRHYAYTIKALPGFGLSWRIDVENRAPSQSAEQQHQLVIWDPKLRTTYGVRLWLQADGGLQGLTGELLTPNALLGRVWQYQRDEENGRRVAHREHVRQYHRALKRRFTLYLLAGGIFLLTGLAAVAFGTTNWIIAARNTSLLLLGSAIAFDLWIYRQRLNHIQGIKPFKFLA